jgi:CRISPR-associated protein Csm1
MVCCDISGIQNFIYNIASAKAAVSLKGRSFYIQLLQEVIQKEILSKTGSQSGHLIYGSGGKCYMLLPNTELVVEALQTARQQITTELWQKQKQKLYACIDWIPFCYRTGLSFGDARIECPEKSLSGEEINNLGDLWAAVTEKAASWKGHKYDYLSTTFFDLFFGKNGKGLDIEGIEACAVTGEEGELKTLKVTRNQEETQLKILKSVFEQIEFGRALKDFDHLLILNEENNDFSTYYDYRINKRIEPLKKKGHTAYFVDSEKSPNEKKPPVTSADFTTVISINDTNFLGPAKMKGIAAGYGFRFYGGNRPPCNVKKEEKTYEELAINEMGDDTFLGVLRMDVDGLGKLFKSGFSTENKSFAAYATLSNALDYFFSGYLNTLREKEEFKDWISIIYAGGDDLFVVGRWAEVIAFAEQVRSHFRAFVAEREDISISGGIALMGKKFPISLAANSAGEAEGLAKHFKNEKLGRTKFKNAITLFGEVISWEDEFPYVKALMLELYGLVKEEKIPKGLLQKLMEWKSHKDYLVQHDKNDYSYRWNAAYYLARCLERLKESNEEHQVPRVLLKRLQQEIFINHKLGVDRYLDLAALAARWAEYHCKENVKSIKMEDHG